VFITHDFDEAIRLADRIAIMKDGAIIQIGTPEQLITAPATDYVAEFTKEIPRAKVLTARSIMVPSAAGVAGGEVAAGTRIAELAAEVVSASRPFNVRDAEGRVVGHITRDAVLEVLVGRPVKA
jgi:glycine betaine/proline transport system ATP-binding protein